MRTVIPAAPRLALLASLVAVAALLAPTSTVSAQYAERGALVGSGEAGVDASGRSVKNHRIRAVHSHDPADLGGTAYFLQRDPFLAYQLGRNLNFREFRYRDGVFSKTGVGNLGGPMPDPTVAKITVENQVSCTGCHNQPYGTPGGGLNFAKDSGLGRNSPHYFGGGLFEMLAFQVRTDLLQQLDTDGSGWVSAAEAMAFRGNITVRAGVGVPDQSPIDFGAPQLNGGATGVPDLNPMIHVWYVDAQGREVPKATRVDGFNTRGYAFSIATFGWGQAPAGGIHGGFRAVNPTLRAFYWDPADGHSGLQAFDPTTTDDPDLNGVSEPSLPGAPQFPGTHTPRDTGWFMHPLGFSAADPDGDGYLTEISEGDLDLAEWFMLNAPRPAFSGTPAEYVAGRALMTQAGCTSCHVAEWHLKAADGTFAGDRRFFDLQVGWSEAAQGLVGRLDRLYTEVGDDYVRDLGAFIVDDLFTDFRQHDMGDGFKEFGYDGVENTVWRTAPLWGVGSGFPWGHDGASLTLEHVILRHGGEAEASKQAYLALPEADREDLLGFLEQLVLYDIESLPSDIDGDGSISEHFFVAGKDTGVERFNPEWLFETPVEIQGMVMGPQGQMIRSDAAVNMEAAYGETLPLRQDTDLDGWPDVWDLAPTSKGYKNGSQ